METPGNHCSGCPVTRRCISSCNDPRLFKRRVRAVFVDGFNRARRELEPDAPAELGDENFFLLQIRLPAAHAGRVELRRPRAVRVPAAYLGGFVGNGTGARHRMTTNVLRGF